MQGAKEDARKAGRCDRTGNPPGRPRLRPGETMEAGPQPLDELMTRFGIANHELAASPGLHLTHKEVQKGRTGRRLTLRTQRRLLLALQTRLPDQPLTLDDLFSYRGR